MILYLHGFTSGPQSHKAQALQRRMQALGLGARYACPQLDHSPRRAIVQAERLLSAAEKEAAPVTLVGSSLGGYYATHLAERHELKAVLVNPAVLAPQSLRRYLGRQKFLYTGEEFELTEEHIRELGVLEVKNIADPGRYWLLVETGDEVLDYRQAVAKYAGARQTVLPGGDHSFTRWEDYLDGILAFAGLKAAA